MQPTAGFADRLFVAGGGTLYKVDPYFSIVNDKYQWTESGSGTNEYYCDTEGGGDPGLTSPDAVLIDGSVAAEGTVGSLTAGQWDWGDNDTLGYNTVYVRLSGGGDPDAQSDDHIKLVYVQNWGIATPEGTIDVADGGAGGELDDGAVYKYRITYYNERTGARGLPTEEPSGTSTDDYTKLLLHCDGADGHTTFTDSSASAHTLTAQGTAEGDTAQKKFGTASLLCDGNSDYLTAPNHSNWYFSDKRFTIDFWVRFNSVAASQGLISQYEGTANYWTLEFDATHNQLDFKAKRGGSTKIHFTTGNNSFDPSVDTWYHIALIRGWKGLKDKWAFTVDGTSIFTGTDVNSPGSFTASLAIGFSDWNDVYLNGWMDEIRISKGIARWTENFTVPASAYAAPAVNLAGGSTSIDLSNIPESSDPQVTHVEIWRTEGGGSTYYLAARLENGTATYTDDTADDDLDSDELPIDNIKPYAWFDDCFGPYNASMFWISRTQEGERGRLYYSPIGRAEALDGYIEVCSDDLGLQKGVIWQGTMFVVGEAGWYEVGGTNPYFKRPVEGVPGTTKPHTVVVTPWGIMYEAEDGIRIFNGSTSTLATTPSDIQRLFRGKTGGSLTAFSGVVASYGRGEYFISDETQLLAYNGKKWRDVGDFSAKSIHFAKDADIIGVGTNADGIYDFEKEGYTEDNSNNIERDIETDAVRVSSDGSATILHVHVDYAKEDLT
jgi:hypothetical protein